VLSVELASSIGGSVPEPSGLAIGLIAAAIAPIFRRSIAKR
jgi:hypothetical protein